VDSLEEEADVGDEAAPLLGVVLLELGQGSHDQLAATLLLSGVAVLAGGVLRQPLHVTDERSAGPVLAATQTLEASDQPVDRQLVLHELVDVLLLDRGQGEVRVQLGEDRLELCHLLGVGGGALGEGPGHPQDHDTCDDCDLPEDEDVSGMRR